MNIFFLASGLAASTLFVTAVNAIPWTNATCTSELWSFNSRQQSPCLVSAYLGSPCSTTSSWGIYDVGAGGGPYVLPAGTANLCLCNSVQWNLLSACSMCQGSPAGSWAAWTTYCLASNTNIGKYPLPIPAGITVPHWAYYDFTNTGVFNAAIASQQAGPESTAAAGSATASVESASTTQTGTASLDLPRPTTTNSSQNSNNTGAIIGGAVGGVLGVALIALIAFVLVRKNKHKAESTSHYPQGTQGGYAPAVGSQPGSAAPMMAQYQPQPERPGMAPLPSSGSDYIYKPYDPSDPSTFPPGLNASSPPTSYTDSLPYTNNPQRPRIGDYNGAPQI